MSNSKPDKQETNRDEKGRFVPGQSGNPKGRPHKESTLSYWLVKYLEEKEKGRDKTRMQELAEKIAVEAFKGDKTLMKEIFDRVEGKPTQRLEHKADVNLNVKTLEEIIDDLVDDKKTKTPKDKDSG